MRTIFYARNQCAAALQKLISQPDGHLRLADALCETAVRLDQRSQVGGPIERHESTLELLDRVALILDRGICAPK